MAYALFGDALWITTDRAWQSLVSGVFALLVCASAAGWTLSLRARSLTTRKTVDNLNARIRAWWVMAAILIVAISAGRTGSVVLFGVVSGLALREFRRVGSSSEGGRRDVLRSRIAPDTMLNGLAPYSSRTRTGLKKSS